MISIRRIISPALLAVPLSGAGLVSCQTKPIPHGDHRRKVHQTGIKAEYLTRIFQKVASAVAWPSH